MFSNIRFLVTILVGIFIGIKCDDAIMHPGDAVGLHLGCYRIYNLPDFPIMLTDTDVSHASCWDLCALNNKTLAKLTRGNKCYCTNEEYEAELVDSSQCNSKCVGNPLQTCGGKHTANVYRVLANPHVLRQSIKNMQTYNIHVIKSRDNEWTRYNDGKIDLIMDELHVNEYAIVLYDQCIKLTKNCIRKYVHLTGSKDLITPVDAISAIEIPAVWDVVWARAISESKGEVVMYFRKTACLWVEKVNGKITKEYSFVSFDDSKDQLVLKNTLSDDDVLYIYPNKMEKETPRGKLLKSYAGRWYNLKTGLGAYFIPDMFKCNASK